jgi:hypothetical protein
VAEQRRLLLPLHRTERHARNGAAWTTLRKEEEEREMVQVLQGQQRTKTCH